MSVDQIQKEDLEEIARCHKEAFPRSFSTLLGTTYLIKNYEWYLESKDTILLGHRSKAGGAINGFAGGLLIHENSEHGSSTGVIQYTFKTALRCLLLRPWLLFHPQMFSNYSLLLRNLLMKLGLKRQPSKSPENSSKKVKRSLGLVVIGTNRQSRGTGIGSELLGAFELEARKMNAVAMHLSVKQSNQKALKAYTRNGWEVEKKHGKNFVMSKAL